MARYVPRHRKKRNLRDHSRAGALAGFVVASIASLSGSFGFTPGALADSKNPLLTPLKVQVASQPGTHVSLPPNDLGSVQSTPSTALVVTNISASSLGALEAVDASTAKQPAFVAIQSLPASSEIVPLGLDPDGSLETPADFNAIGWYTGSVEPGEPGASVFAGHVASRFGPGIFKNLIKLKPGDTVRVARRDGVRLTFAVTRIDTYPKDYFPTEQVYGPTSARELRLITCGGNFSAKLGTYESNVVVYATLVENP